MKILAIEKETSGKTGKDFEPGKFYQGNLFR